MERQTGEDSSFERFLSDPHAYKFAVIKFFLAFYGLIIKFEQNLWLGICSSKVHGIKIFFHWNDGLQKLRYVSIRINYAIKFR